LLAKGVECESLNTGEFKAMEQMKHFFDKGGKVFAFSNCLKFCQYEGSEICPLSTMKDSYEIIKDSDKIVAF